MEYEKPFTGWNVLLITIVSALTLYYGSYAVVWVFKYFWGIIP